MRWLVPVLLGCLCITDGGFAGFRDAAGRTGHIFKEEYYRRAIRRGLRYGLLAAAVDGVVVGVALLASPSPLLRLDELVVCGEWLLPVLAAYATLVLLALGVWAAAEADVRTLGSVIILGPFTLIRPYVVAVAALLAAWKAPSVAAAAVTALACGVQLSIEPLLGRVWKTPRF